MLVPIALNLCVQRFSILGGGRFHYCDKTFLFCHGLWTQTYLN